MKHLKQSAENGVAIILALIFLAIFMILAFAFTARAVSAGRSATYQSGELQAQILCDSALNKVLNQIDAITTTSLPESDSNFVTAISGPTNIINYKIYPSTGTAISSSTDYQIDAFGVSFAPSGTAAPKWETITSSDPNVTAGLFTWYAISMSDRMDPNYSKEASGRTAARAGLTTVGEDPASNYLHEIPISSMVTTGSYTGKFWKSIQHVAGINTADVDTAWQSMCTHGQYVQWPVKSTGTNDLSVASPVINLDGITSTSTGVAGRIWANLTDMVDQDTTCTTNAEGDLGIEPTQPLLNELAVSINNQSVVGETKIKFFPKFDVELIRLATGAGDVTVRLTGNFIIEYTGVKPDTTSVTATITHPFDVSIVLTSAASEILSAPGYYAKKTNLSSAANVLIATADLPDSIVLTTSDVKVISAKLDSITLNPATDLIKPSNTLLINKTLKVDDILSMNLSAWDPRVNYALDLSSAVYDDLTSHWFTKIDHFVKATEGAIPFKDIDTLKELNLEDASTATSYLFNPANTDDSEAVSGEVLQASTVVGLESPSIAKAPKSTQNLSVIGLVSRGQRFRTLNIVDRGAPPFNLTAFKDSANYQSTSNGGDGWILDLCHLGANDPDNKIRQVYSVINLNAASSTTLKGLFGNIPVDDGSVTPIPDPIIARFPSQINSYIPVWDDANLISANPLGYGKIFSTASGISDRAREEYYWKTKNLVSPNDTYYMVVTVVKTGYNLAASSANNAGLMKMVALVKRRWVDNEAGVSIKKFKTTVLSREYIVE